MLPDHLDKQARKAEREALRASMLERIGTVAHLPVDDHLTVAVTITGVRDRYGNLDYEITPVAGSGTRSVTPRRLILA